MMCAQSLVEPHILAYKMVVYRHPSHHNFEQKSKEFHSFQNSLPYITFTMIHPINIPEDLLAANPQRPQLFRPRPKVRISYGQDGRRLDQDGKALEPLSPNTYWKDVFMRTFIRRLVPTSETPSGDEQQESLPAHVDIVDLSPSPSSAEEASLAQTLKKEEENERKSSTDSSASIPDRPDLEAASSTEEEEADGDHCARMGKAAKPVEPEDFKPRRISQKAVRSILKFCCTKKMEENFQEFARLDFSQVDLFGSAVGEKDEEFALIPAKWGNRVWTAKKQQQQYHSMLPCIQFHIGSVKIRPGKEVTICMEAHNALANKLNLQVETHLHLVQNEQISECLGVWKQMECFENGKENQFCVRITLGEQVGKDGKSQNQTEKDEFLLATIHGKIIESI